MAYDGFGNAVAIRCGDGREGHRREQVGAPVAGHPLSDQVKVNILVSTLKTLSRCFGD